MTLVDTNTGPNSFSLVFEGPPEPVLAQATYTFHHDELGDMQVFIVPIGPRAGDTMGYEAVFTEEPLGDRD